MSSTRRWPRRRVVMALGVAAATFASGAACNDTLQGTIAIVTGPDDPFQQDPKPTSLLVQLINQDGGITKFPKISLPTDAGLSIPQQNGTDIDSIQVTGFDDAGDAVASGQSIAVELDELSGVTLNLFMQRTGQFSRLPEAGIVTTTPPILTNLFGRYLLVAESNGSPEAGLQLYDTLTWQTLGSPPSLSVPPRSLVYVDQFTGSDAALEAGGTTPIAALFSIGSSSFQCLDLTDSTSADAEINCPDAALPSGGSFSGVAGGATVFNTTTGDIYVVGPTRTSSPTDLILKVTPTGVMSYLTLHSPRAGAAATFLPSTGLLYVLGGTPKSSAGDAGVNYGGESFNPTDGTVTELMCLPGDTTTGAAAIPVNGTFISRAQILLVGGVTPSGGSAGVRLYDTNNCSAPNGFGIPTPWIAPGATGDGGTGIAFTQTQAFSAGASNVVVVGTEKNGTVSAYELAPAPDGGTPSATLLPFRKPHTLSTAIVLPNGSLAVVGGDASMESYIP